MGRDITLQAGNQQTFGAYYAEPRNSPANRKRAPGIVLIQEIFGVNRFVRVVADRFAGAGFIVLAPDLFWRQQPGIQLDSGSESDRATAMQLMKQLNVALALEDCAVALDHLRALPACSGKVGAVGYCLGGKLAYLMATRSSADASVGYYGVGIQDALDEARNIRKPLMLHIAGEDHLCPPAAQKLIADRLAELDGLAQVHLYPDAGHAFAREGGPAYRAASAKEADSRTLEFLRRHLQGA